MSELSQDIATDLDAATFARIAAVLHEVSGIRLEEANGSLVVSRLAKRLRTLGLQSFREYGALIADPAARSERYEMVLALTTNTTRFFREPCQRRSKNRPNGGAKADHFGVGRDGHAERRRPVSRAPQIAGG